MKNNKIYSFIASPVLWTKENRVAKIEDLPNAPYYEELMFELKLNADIEPLIAAKDNKFKSDDFKAKKEEFQKKKDSYEKQIARLENRANKLENMEKYINYVYGAVQDIMISFPKDKKQYLKNLLSGYARNGMFMISEVNMVKAKSNNFIKAWLTSSKRKKANEKLDRFIKYCEDNNLYGEFQTDPNGKSKNTFDAIMCFEPIVINTFFAEITGQIDNVTQEIETAKAEIIQGENSIELSNEGYERDNYVLIDIENEIIRKYAKQVKEKLFPQEIKQEIIKKSEQENTSPKLSVDKRGKKISKFTDFINQIKTPDFNVMKTKVTKVISVIKNILKKK